MCDTISFEVLQALKMCIHFSCSCLTKSQSGCTVTGNDMLEAMQIDLIVYLTNKI